MAMWALTRTQQREGRYDDKQRIVLLEGDMDEVHNDMGEIKKLTRTMLKVLFTTMASTMVASLLLAANLAYR